MGKNPDTVPHVFEVTVERERTIIERRTVRVTAYTSSAATNLAKKMRPKEGWVEVELAAGTNSASTTRFLQTQSVQDLGEMENFPASPEGRREILNSNPVKIQSEF